MNSSFFQVGSLGKMFFCFKGTSLSAATARKDFAAAFLNYLGLLIFFLSSNCAWLWPWPTKFFPLPQQLKCGGALRRFLSISNKPGSFYFIGLLSSTFVPPKRTIATKCPPSLGCGFGSCIASFFHNYWRIDDYLGNSWELRGLNPRPLLID